MEMATRIKKIITITVCNESFNWKQLLRSINVFYFQYNDLKQIVS